MRLKVIEVNFTRKYDWIFKLIDSFGNLFYIMDDSFYNLNNLTTPINKHELDYLDKGYSLVVETELVDNINVVTSIK